MQASQKPSKIQLPWANGGTKNAIPVASQIGTTPGAASFTDGFPPLTMTPLASGGVPPSGADFNGVLNAITAIQQWQSSGGAFPYDATFVTAIGGYPKGAVLVNAANDGYWLNLADNNSTNPDATDGTAANWYPLDASGITAVTGLTNANVTLTPAQYGKPTITLAGTLTANIQITFPALNGVRWNVINNTTGTFSVTCKTSAGSGVVVQQGVPNSLYSDGTNIANASGLGNYQGLVSISAATTLLASQSGAVISLSGTAFTITLPAASLGRRYVFYTASAGVAYTLATTGGASIYNGGTAAPTYTLPPNSLIELLCVGNDWIATQLGGGLGYAPQSWQNVTGSRALSTSYTNSTGKPIMVSVEASNAVASSSMSVALNVGAAASVSQQDNISAGTVGYTGLSVCGIVPPGASYTITGTQINLVRWLELR